MSMGYVAAGIGGALLASGSGGGGGGGSVDPAVGQAALRNAAISEDAWAWYKQKETEMRPYTDKAIQIGLDQAKTQLETAKKQNAMADETYQYTKETFRPIEQEIAKEALNYDTPERRAAESAQAQADVGSAAEAARVSLARDIQSRGGDVNSGNFTATMGNLAIQEAAAKAGAGNQARKNVEVMGAAKRADAANLGRGIATGNATQTQLGLTAGNSAVNNAQVPLNLTAQQAGIMNSVAGTAGSLNASSGNMLLGQYNAQTRANENANSTNNALIGAAGTVLGAYMRSDKNKKKGRRPASARKAMEAVRKTPVERWKYRDDVPGADGEEHIGPMAQDVQRHMGEKAAPGGKVIDLVSMNGITLAAVKDLDSRMKRLERKRA